MAMKHQSDNRLVSPLSHLQNRPSISVAIIGLGQGMLHSHPASQGYIISNLSPVFNSIPELCNSSGPSILTKVVPISKSTSSVKLGLFSSNSAPPLGYIPWNRPGFIPPKLMHSWDPLSPWFSVLDKFSLNAGGVPTPAMIFPLLGEGHVNNHISLGVPPPNTDTQTPCQIEVTPPKSEGIEPFTLVNSPPGQVEVSSSHPINLLSGQVGVIPCKSEGIKPFTMVNSPLCQVGVTPCSPGGIEPSTLVNSPPGQVGATPSHMINTPSGPCEVASSVLSCVPVSVFPSVSPVLPLMLSTSVLVPITDRLLPVTSPLCPLTSDPSSTSLNPTQAMSHKQPVDLPTGLGHP